MLTKLFYQLATARQLLHYLYDRGRHAYQLIAASWLVLLTTLFAWVVAACRFHEIRQIVPSWQPILMIGWMFVGFAALASANAFVVTAREKVPDQTWLQFYAGSISMAALCTIVYAGFSVNLAFGILISSLASVIAGLAGYRLHAPSSYPTPSRTDPQYHVRIKYRPQRHIRRLVYR